MKNTLIIKILILITLAFSPLSYAVTVETSGMGDTDKIALSDALRNAVSQGAGLKLTSYTAVKNLELETDRIVSGTSGIVTNYEIIGKPQKSDDGLYTINIRADVDKVAAQKTFAQFAEDTNTQKIFQKQTFENRRVAIVYNKERSDNLSPKSKGIQTLMSHLRDQMTAKGFRIFLQRQLVKLRQYDTDTLLNKNTILKAAQSAGAQVLVLVQLEAGQKLTPDGYAAIMADMNFEMYDTSTGAFIAAVTQRGKTISRKGNYAIDNGISRIASKYGQMAGDKLMQKIVEYLSGPTQKIVVLVFQEITSEEQDMIESIIVDDLGWEIRIQNQTDHFMEIEVYELDFRTVKRKLSRSLIKNNIRLKRNISGQRITYRKY